MIDTFALGEQVRKDPKLTMKKKEEVKVHLNSLTARWDRVKDFLTLRRERYENGFFLFYFNPPLIFKSFSHSVSSPHIKRREIMRRSCFPSFQSQAICLICAVVFLLRLEESSKRLQRDRRHKLQDWEERLNSIDTFLRKAERETEKLEPIGDDLETVRRQHEDFEVCAGHDHDGSQCHTTYFGLIFCKVETHNGKGKGTTKQYLFEPLYCMTIIYLFLLN